MANLNLYRAVLAGSMAVLVPAAVGQHGGHGMGGPPGGGSGFAGGDFGRDRNGPPSMNGRDSAGTASTMRGGLQLGPPGRWWDDKQFAKDLKLRPDQQRRMDNVFDANRQILVKKFQDLEAEQNRMESLVRSKSLEEPALFSQIDRIAQARAELEKANTHLLLQIRAEMDADQINRLEQHRPQGSP